jgi:SAM-dependent methyltransferase
VIAHDIAAGVTPRAVFDLEQWSAPASADERALLHDVRSPVLDIGCGPGRLVAALRDRRVEVLGIDAAPLAIARARAYGRKVVQRSVFDPIPAEGSWATVLLFDGNIGIGGSPARLLTRVHELLTVGGRAIVETEPPGTGVEFGMAELEVATGMIGWFPWSWVAADELAVLAEDAGFRVDDCRVLDGRWFTWLSCR